MLRVSSEKLKIYFVYNLLYNEYSCINPYFYTDLLFHKNKSSLLQYVLNGFNSDFALSCVN